MPDPGDSPAALVTGLDALFPAGVVTVLSFAPDEGAQLGPGEAASAARFVPSRLAEFRHGRACARRALARLGIDAPDIPAGAGREPVWPRGIVGSITHAGDVAAAAVASSAQFLGVGLDVETAAELEPGLIPRICLPEEIAGLHTAAGGTGQAAKILFSIKEAAYKALWPSLQLVLDFHDIAIRLDEDGASFAVMSRSDRCPAALAARVEGRWLRLRELITAGAAVRV